MRSSSLHKEPKQEPSTVQDCVAQDDGAPIISPQPYDAINSASAEDITADAAEAPAATLPDATSDEALSSTLVCFKPVVALLHASNQAAMIPAAPAQIADESQHAVYMQAIEEITPPHNQPCCSACLNYCRHLPGCFLRHHCCSS